MDSEFLMKDSFEADRYPGKPKILFVGMAHSTHTQSWIRLLEESELNVRLFSLPWSYAPSDWPIKIYDAYLSKQRNSATRRYLYRGLFGLITYYLYRISTAELSWGYWSRIVEMYKKVFGYLTPEAWLAKIIRTWKPDLIHTLGLFDMHGGEFFYRVWEQYNLKGIGKWVLQLRGGSDVTLRRHQPEQAALLQAMLKECHQVITDNLVNVEYLRELGIPEDKFSPIIPVPGTGGIDANKLAFFSTVAPSRRERSVVWPKAAEGPWAEVLPVLEALRIAWQEIRPCSIHILNSSSRVGEWLQTLPATLQRACVVHGHIPRDDFLALLARARILLAPSLVDGVPNILYEAMACGAFPIVSPLDTIRSAVSDENVLFARNLYPNEIAEALATAMSNDQMVDAAAETNFDLVRQIANRNLIRPQVIGYYQSLVEM